jgi:tRNA_anti-like
MKKNFLSMIVAVGILCFVGLGCQSIKNLTADSKKPETPTTATPDKPGEKPTPTKAAEADKKDSTSVVSDDDKPEFTLTAEEIYKEYTDSEKLGPTGFMTVADKYKDKVVQISGRFEQSDNKEKEGEFGFRLKGGGTFHWVNCKVDPENKAQYAGFKPNQKVTFKGIGGQFWIGGPHFDNCTIVAEK